MANMSELRGGDNQESQGGGIGKAGAFVAEVAAIAVGLWLLDTVGLGSLMLGAFLIAVLLLIGQAMVWLLPSQREERRQQAERKANPRLGAGDHLADSFKPDPQTAYWEDSELKP